MLKDRQKSILGAVIEAYIRTARPVASQELARECDFGLSPATLRNEMNCLDELGYVEQPHTSAGRIPTDRGYRFFVDHLLGDDALTPREQESLNEVFELRDEEEFVRELTRAIAGISGMFTAAGLDDDGACYKTGFASILNEPEFEDQNHIRAFARVADMLDDEMRNFLPPRNRGADDAMIFIGRENPWKEARDYAMAFSLWHHPRGFRGFVSMIGPKRTNYQKHKAIMKRIKNYE